MVISMIWYHTPFQDIRNPWPLIKMSCTWNSLVMITMKCYLVQWLYQYFGVTGRSKRPVHRWESYFWYIPIKRFILLSVFSVLLYTSFSLEAIEEWQKYFRKRNIIVWIIWNKIKKSWKTTKCSVNHTSNVFLVPYWKLVSISIFRNKMFCNRNLKY